MKKSILFAAGIAVLAAGPAFGQSACLRYDNIYNWNALDNKTLIVEDDFHKKFKVTLFAYCPSLTFKQTLAFKSFSTTRLSCVSPGDSVITREFGTGTQRCPVKTVEAYTPEMQKADADAAAAKKAAQ